MSPVSANPSASTSGPPAPLADPYAAEWRSLVDLLPDAVLVLDRDWRIVYANAESRRVSRLPAGDLPDATHWELYPETVGVELERVYRTAMETRLPADIVYHHAPFDVWLDVHVRPVADGLALHYRDITERKRVDAERDAALRQLHQVFEASADSIVCLDRQWDCTYANGVAGHLLQGNPVGKNVWKDFPSLLAEPYYSNFWATMVKRTPTEFETYYPEPLNLWFKVYARPFAEGIIVFSSDITASKQAEAQREATANQLQTVFDVMSDGVASLDPDWNFTFLNRRGEELLRPADRLLGKNIWTEFPQVAGTEFQRAYERTMHDRVPTEFEAFSPASQRWLAVEARPSDGGIVIFFNDISERRRSDELMRKQQELLTVVQQAARVATFDIDLDTRQVTYGPGSFEVYGRPFSELRSIEDFQRYRLPQYHDPIGATVRRAIETLDPVTVEFEAYDRNGETRWLESRFQAVPVAGVARYLRGIAIDITERKRHEAVLVASEARYRALTELNPQGIWMADAEGNVTYANQVMQDYTGIPITALSGTSWLGTFTPLDQARLMEVWQRSVATGADYDIEIQMRRSADGLYRWWNLRALPIRGEGGEILYWLGIGTDIHDARTYAETLRIQHEETERQRVELESVYESAPIGLALFDPREFRYLRLNERQAQLVGLPKKSILGRTLTEIAPIEGLREMFEQVAAGNPIRNQLLEGELPTAPGEHRYWTVNYFPVYGPDGSVQAITAASLEITNQKKAEAALIQSEKLAAVGRLASSISHEINNPLEAVTNLLYLLGIAGTLPEDLKVYVHMAQSEIARVSQIATQTLRFHRQAVRPTQVTAADLVQAVLNLYQGRLANSGIAVESRYDTDKAILCFENDIRQVLNNLIANAIDAMRTGGRLVVRAHNATEPATGRNGVRLVIADTGHGMSALVRARVFEPFYTTKDLNGTGLGLWISEGIVQRHRGRLAVRSSEHPVHHGTVFSLFLPLEEPELKP